MNNIRQKIEEIINSDIIFLLKNEPCGEALQGSKLFVGNNGNS